MWKLKEWPEHILVAIIINQTEDIITLSRSWICQLWITMTKYMISWCDWIDSQVGITVAKLPRTEPYVSSDYIS